MNPLAFLLLSFATFRASRLVTTDALSEPARAWLRRRFPPRVVPFHGDDGQPVAGSGTQRPRWPVVLSSCDWCITPYLAAGAALGAHAAGFIPQWRWVALGWAGTAAAAGLLSDLSDRMTR